MPSFSATFIAMRFVRLRTTAAFLLSCVFAQAQIISMKQDGDKTITCMHTGLSSDLRDCGSKSNWYSYVFVGSISSISAADKDERELQITPEEIFLGNPPTSLRVRTSQVACLPKLSVGDRWLFFLKEAKGSPILIDYYGNPSIPVESAQDEIETLRRLKTLGDEGLLRGSVQRGKFGVETPVPQAQVVLERFPDKLRFFATTDASGRYEFQPIPAGRYNISVSPVGSFQADSGTVNIDAGGCWDLTLRRSPHARIAGHVRRSDGSPVADVPVVILTNGESGYNSSTTNKDGYYEFDSLEPGKYVVGISFPNAPAWKHRSCGGACDPPAASLYYPGTHSRLDALSIKLAMDEKRSNIDFVVP